MRERERESKILKVNLKKISRTKCYLYIFVAGWTEQ